MDPYLLVKGPSIMVDISCGDIAVSLRNDQKSIAEMERN